MAEGKTENLFQRRITSRTAGFLLSFLLILSSCNSKVLYTGSAEMKENTWQLMNVPEFRVPVNDTLTGNDIFFVLRTGSDYPFRNIFLFVTATSPDGKKLTDTLQYYLADDKGKWYGKGFGDIKELKLPYRSNVFFPLKGEYTFNVQHGMRTEDLEGVYDIGIRIEKKGK